MRKPGFTPSVVMVGNFLSASTSTRGIGEEFCDRLRERSWQVITTSSKPGRMARLADMVYTVIAQRNVYQAAYVEVYSGLSFFWAEVVCFILRQVHKPYMLGLHGGRLPYFARRWPGRVANLLKPAAAVSTPSHWIQDEFSALRPDIGYLPNGIDLARYPFRLRKSPQPVLAWLRAFHSIYQPWTAVAAMRELIKDFPDAYLVMIGPDKKDRSLEHVLHDIDKFHLRENVQVIKGVPKSEVPNWLSFNNIFLNTTRYESFGVSVLEAAACGLGIVTADVGEIPYLWQDGENVLLVPREDPAAIAAAVRRILTEPGLAELLSLNGRAKAEAYDWSSVLPIWEKLFFKMLDHG